MSLHRVHFDVEVDQADLLLLVLFFIFEVLEEHLVDVLVDL